MTKQLLRAGMIGVAAWLGSTVGTLAQNAYSVVIDPPGPVVLPLAGSQLLSATVLTTPFNANGSGFNGFVRAILPLPDGKLLVGGIFFTYNGASCPANLVRLNGDGTLDSSFNANGSGLSGPVYTLLLQPDGKVLVGGQFFPAPGGRRIITRLNSDGTLDPTFEPGRGGNLTGGSVSAIAVNSNGQILIGGSFIGGNGQTNINNLMRLNADGSIDAAFNQSGTGVSGSVSSLFLLTGGKVLVGGNYDRYNNNPNISKGLLRLNADGSLDVAFNASGAGFNTSNLISPVLAVLVEPNGQILVAGAFSTYNGLASCPDGLARLNADGTLDATFNPGGIGVELGANSVISSVTRQSNGQLLVGGRFSRYNGAACPDNLIRLNASGARDATFNPGGAGFDNYINTVVVRTDGRALVGGDMSRYNGAVVPADLISLAPDGAYDTSPLPITSGVSFLWSPGGQTTPDITAQQPGVYTVTATVGNSSATRQVSLLQVTSRREPQWAARVKLWPNPASGGIEVQVPNGAGSVKAVLYNAIGQRIPMEFKWTVGAQRLHFDVGGQASGVYHLQLRIGTDTIIRPLVVE